MAFALVSNCFSEYTKYLNNFLYLIVVQEYDGNLIGNRKNSFMVPSKEDTIGGVVLCDIT